MKSNFYKDKVVVVTGASSGIGRSLAIYFANEGARVMLGARRESKLIEVVDIIKSFNGKALYCVTDVTQENLCAKLISTTVDSFGRIDILICNAGISMRANFFEVDISVLHRLMDVNFWGTVYCVKYALPYLLETGGSVVGISSIAGIHGLPGRTGYSASKFAITGFLETVRVENLKNKLHVMIAIPGFTSSNIRYAALTADGSQQGTTPRNEGKMMSADKAAKHIANGIKRKKHYLILNVEGKAILFVKKITTTVLDRSFYRAMAKEPDSPLK